MGNQQGSNLTNTGPLSPFLYSRTTNAQNATGEGFFDATFFRHSKHWHAKFWWWCVSSLLGSIHYCDFYDGTKTSWFWQIHLIFKVQTADITILILMLA